MNSLELLRPLRYPVRQGCTVTSPVPHDRRSDSRPETSDRWGTGACGSNTYIRESLYAEFAPLVRRLIRQYGQDSEIRQDLAGEIYCRFCALLEAYDPERGVPLRPYLVRQLSAATYTYARQQWRIQRRETAWDTDPGLPEGAAMTDPTQTWVSALSQQQVMEALPQALMKLPSRQRKVVIWRYYEERSFEEIAQLLDVQQATARSLLRHGLTALRKQILPTAAE